MKDLSSPCWFLPLVLLAGGPEGPAAGTTPSWEASPDRQAPGRFWRWHWYERGLTHGNPASKKRFRVAHCDLDRRRRQGQRVFQAERRALSVAEGAGHELVCSRLPVHRPTLRRGLNRIELLSDTEHHGIEVIYPGPALMVRYGAQPQ